jgi:hypothetical protein
MGIWRGRHGAVPLTILLADVLMRLQAAAAVAADYCDPTAV